MGIQENVPELFFHTPVLVQEVLEYLHPGPEKVYVDVTFGSGGHTKAILERQPHCRVIALDWDKVSIDTYAPRLEALFGDRFQVVWGNFADIKRVLKKIGVSKVDGILADFGTSQMHITQRAGFSVYRDMPLDMRMSPAHHRTTAAYVLQKASEQNLREIFWEYGQERYSKQIARAIVAHRKRKPLKTTKELADLVARSVPFDKKTKIHPATRVFQALRIYVNRELDNIHSFLPAALDLLNEGGKLVCISFHSLEDRLVKRFFQEQQDMTRVKILTKKAVTATQEEIEENPSSRSAKLRAAERL